MKHVKIIAASTLLLFSFVAKAQIENSPPATPAVMEQKAIEPQKVTKPPIGYSPKLSKSFFPPPPPAPRAAS
jgi:hypothetical protein